MKLYLKALATVVHGYRRSTLTSGLAIFFLLPIFALQASTLLVEQKNPEPGYGYGLPGLSHMTADLTTAFGGAANITVNTTDLGDASAFDALWIMAPVGGSPGLTAAEQANLSAFIASGKRVVIIGENSAWTDWDSSFISLLGGSYTGLMTGNEVLTPMLVHPVTAGLSSVHVGDDGIAIGGTSLFSKNVVTLWGSQQNVITVLSISMIDNASAGSYTDNVAFKANLANWLASPVTETTPEPATVVLIVSGLSGLFLGYRRKS